MIYGKMLGRNDGYQVFLDFLDWVIANFNINPHFKFKWRGKYSDEEKGMFFKLFTELVKEISEALDKGKGYYDFLGEFYEDTVQSSYKASNMGQFFTPHDVSDLMVRLVNDGHDEVRSVYDCAAGSGRMLLAHHAECPEDIIVAWELDEVSAKMCVINFLLHGVRGSVCCMNSLSREFYFGFKVNEMMEYGMCGVPHLMDVGCEAEASVFMGVESVVFEVKQSGQTTLI